MTSPTVGRMKKEERAQCRVFISYSARDESWNAGRLELALRLRDLWCEVVPRDRSWWAVISDEDEQESLNLAGALVVLAESAAIRGRLQTVAKITCREHCSGYGLIPLQLWLADERIKSEGGTNEVSAFAVTPRFRGWNDPKVFEASCDEIAFNARMRWHLHRNAAEARVPSMGSCRDEASTTLHRDGLVRVIEVVSSVLPRQINDEEIGDLLERLHALRKLNVAKWRIGAVLVFGLSLGFLHALRLCVGDWERCRGGPTRRLPSKLRSNE